MENSRHIIRPPGFNTRSISVKPCSMWVTLRMPKLTITASNSAGSVDYVLDLTLSVPLYDNTRYADLDLARAGEEAVVA